MMMVISMLHQFHSKKDAVEHIISKVPAAAYNNNLLVVLYWRIFDGVDIPGDVAKRIVSEGTSPETITRARRKIVETGRNNTKENSL